MKLFVLKALLYTLLTYSQVTLADELYRCNNGYQDTPCKSVVSGQVVSKKPVPISGNSVSDQDQSMTAMDIECKEHGEVAKKIAQLRDTGKTADQQMKILPDDASRALIQDVYKRRGAPLQVQNAIEHECMQKKEKDRLTKKQMIEAESLRNGGNFTSKSNPNGKAKLQPPTTTQKADIKKEVVLANEPDSDTHEKGNAQQVRDQKSNKQIANSKNQGDDLGICSAFKSGIDNIAIEKRKGGDDAHMSDLKEQQNQLEHEMKSAGC